MKTWKTFTLGLCLAAVFGASGTAKATPVVGVAASPRDDLIAAIQQVFTAALVTQALHSVLDSYQWLAFSGLSAGVAATAAVSGSPFDDAGDGIRAAVAASELAIKQALKDAMDDIAKQNLAAIRQVLADDFERMAIVEPTVHLVVIDPAELNKRLTAGTFPSTLKRRAGGGLAVPKIHPSGVAFTLDSPLSLDTSDGQGLLRLEDADLRIFVAPEPSTLALTMMALLGAAGVQRRRRNGATASGPSVQAQA